jgi:ATP-dependent Lon protease
MSDSEDNINDKRKSDYNLRPRKKNKNRRIIDSDSDSDSEEEEEEEEITIDFTELLSGILNSREGGFQYNQSLEPNENDKYLSSLTQEERDELKATEEKIKKLNFSSIPLKYKVLQSSLEDKSKALLMQKVTYFEKLEPHQGEYFKLKKYMDGILNIPFNKYKGLDIVRMLEEEDNVPVKIKIIKEFIIMLRSKLNTSTFGQLEAKNTIIEIIGKWISNPSAKGNVLGLEGEPGTGKTTIVKNGLANALEIPFAFIPLGGSMNAMSLEGSSYTYEGARWGRIVDILMEHKCMNPILFFDELDKIPNDKFGEEVTALLIHLTDGSQNSSFHDKYFSGIDFDLSKCFIIFSFNDRSKIHPILRDRINIVKVKGFEMEEKLIIAKDYCLNSVCQNIGIERSLIDVPDETLRTIITTYCPEKGVRKVEQCLNSLVMKINLFHITRDVTNLGLKDKSLFKHLSAPYVVTPELAIKLLDPIYRNDDMSTSVKMMYI